MVKWCKAVFFFFFFFIHTDNKLHKVYFHRNAQLGLCSRQQECNMRAIFCFHCTCCSKHSWTRCSQTFILLLSFVLCCWFVLSGLSLALFSQKPRLCSCGTNLGYVWFIMQMDRRINCVKNKTIKYRQLEIKNLLWCSKSTQNLRAIVKQSHLQ